jgi:hypothetical protein
MLGKINQTALKTGAADAGYGIQSQADQNQPAKPTLERRLEVSYTIAHLPEDLTIRDLVRIEKLQANIEIIKKGERFSIRLL